MKSASENDRQLVGIILTSSFHDTSILYLIPTDQHFDRRLQELMEYAFDVCTWKAQTLADIYKERWHIEVFFGQVKQNLKIKSFVGTSENAVQIQIWTALMSILVLKFLKHKAHYEWNLPNLITFVRLNLFVKIDLDKWLNYPFYQSNSATEDSQLSFFDG